MVLYRKSLIVCFLLVVYSVCQGQEKPTEICENVFFYITMSGDKAKKNSKYYPLTLLIDNQSKDSILIGNFNKYIFHKLDYTKNKKTFYWEFLTTSNQLPDDILIITGAKPNNQTLGEDVEVVIPPNSTFISDIYIQYSSFIKYGKGYYKLCLYFEKSSRCIAELIIKNE